MPVTDSSTMMNKLTIAIIASLDHDCSPWIISVGGATGQSQHLEGIQGIAISVEYAEQHSLYEIDELSKREPSARTLCLLPQ